MSLPSPNLLSHIFIHFVLFFKLKKRNCLVFSVILKMFCIEDVPNEVLEHILYNVDQDTLRSKCVHVSNEWKQMIQSLSFWKRYHRYWTNKTTTNSNQRNKIPDELFCGSYDWVFFSHINPNDNPFERNLLRNGNGSMVSAEELKSQHHRYFEGD